jgi:competence protein ComEA
MADPPTSGWVPAEGVPIDAPPEPVSPARQAEPPRLGELARDWVLDRAPLWAHGWIERLSLGSAVIAAAVVLAVVLLARAELHHHAAGNGDPSYAAPPAADLPPASVATALPTDATASSIVVDVGGRVRRPGLVTLPPGARVADALAAAGGPLRHREVATLDLAAHVSDGQLLLIGVKTDPAGAAAAPATPSSASPVSLNSATLAELETLPGVGPVTAQKIIDWRTAHSGFTSVEQLQQVSGIGPATYAELSPLVTP